eukprot:ANDGO_06172.mRNA.1 hypothetical protein
MGKSTWLSSAKKKGSSDFQKVKVKLGKRPQPANPLSIKTRKLTIITQSILKSQSTSIPVTHRQWSLSQCITNAASHFNKDFRKDGILGIRELLQPEGNLEHPSHVGLLRPAVDVLGRRLSDDEMSVRSAVVSASKDLFPLFVSSQSLFSLWILYLNSGVTSQGFVIQNDASRCLLDFCKMFKLAVTEDAHAPKTQSSGMKKDVSAQVHALASSIDFEESCMKVLVPSIAQTLFTLSKTTKRSLMLCFVSILRWFVDIKALMSGVTSAKDEHHTSPWNVLIQSTGLTASSGTALHVSKNSKVSAVTLYLDHPSISPSAPSTAWEFLKRRSHALFGDSSEDAATRSSKSHEAVRRSPTHHVPWVTISKYIVSMFLESESRDSKIDIVVVALYILENHIHEVGKEFPVQIMKHVLCDFPSDPQNVEWNIVCAKVLLLLSPSDDRVLQFILAYFASGFDNMASHQSWMLGEVLEMAFSFLCLPSLKSEQAVDLINAVLSRFQQVHHLSVHKKKLLQFMHTIATDFPQHSSLLPSTWIVNLPKLLFVVGAADADFTLLIGRIVLDTVRSHRLTVQESQMFLSKLGPFFYCKSRKTGKDIYGPFLSLHATLQCLFVDVLFFLDVFKNEELMTAVAKSFTSVVNGHPVSPSALEHLFEMCGLSMQVSSSDDHASNILSFIVSVLRNVPFTGVEFFNICRCLFSVMASDSEVLRTILEQSALGSGAERTCLLFSAVSPFFLDNNLVSLFVDSAAKLSAASLEMFAQFLLRGSPSFQSLVVASPSFVSSIFSSITSTSLQKWIVLSSTYRSYLPGESIVSLRSILSRFADSGFGVPEDASAQVSGLLSLL